MEVMWRQPLTSKRSQTVAPWSKTWGKGDRGNPAPWKGARLFAPTLAPLPACETNVPLVPRSSNVGLPSENSPRSVLPHHLHHIITSSPHHSRKRHIRRKHTPPARHFIALQPLQKRPGDIVRAPHCKRLKDQADGRVVG